MEFDELEIPRYEVVKIVNENRNTIMIIDNIDVALSCFNCSVDSINNNTKNHIVIFIYDYDKNTNIKYYDSEFDIC